MERKSKLCVDMGDVVRNRIIVEDISSYCRTPLSPYYCIDVLLTNGEVITCNYKTEEVRNNVLIELDCVFTTTFFNQSSKE